jgi:hypothetical protein
VKASTLEKINTRLQKELAATKRRARKAELALEREKVRAVEIAASRLQIAEQRDRSQKDANERRAELLQLALKLHEAKGVWYRIGKTVESLLANWVERKKQRTKNWFLVKRLNKPRVEAIAQAGYIPSKLIKMAHAYYEHDQKRMEHDEEIVWKTGTDYTHYSRKPGLIRKFKIWMGRA